MIQSTSKSPIILIDSALNAGFGVFVGLVGAFATVEVPEVAKLNIETQMVLQRTDGTGIDGELSLGEKGPLAKELVALRSQFNQKIIELEQVRRKLTAEMDALKLQQEMEKQEITEFNARVRRRQNIADSANRVLNDLPHWSHNGQYYKIGSDEIHILNDRYLVRGRPIESENYDTNFWSSCLIEVKSGDTGEIISRSIFKKGTPQMLSVGEARVNLTLSATPNLSSGCLFVASN